MFLIVNAVKLKASFFCHNTVFFKADDAAALNWEVKRLDGCFQMFVWLCVLGFDAVIYPFQIHVYSQETGKPTVCVGNSPGDFTCINLRDAPPHLLVCGNKDRRWEL